MDGRERARATGLALFSFILAIYLLTFGGVFYSIDEEIYLRMTRSLVEHGSFAIAPIEYAPDFSVAPGLDGQTYANRGPGWPLAAVPFYLLGRTLAGLGAPSAVPSPDGIAEPSVFTLSLTLANTIVVAGLATLLFATLRRLGYPRAVAAAVALLLAFGTMAWAYAAKSFFAEPLLALCSLGAFYLTLRYRQGGSTWLLLAAGCVLGWGVLTKVNAFALIPCLAAYAAWPRPGRPLSARAALRPVAGLALGVAPFVVAWMAYNYLRFGDVLTTGYELEGGFKPLTVGDPGLLLLGLYGLTLSPGKGLLLYATPVLLGLWGLPRFWRTHPAEAAFVGTASLITLIGVAIWRDWSGGWCWGPRLVLNVVPLLLVPAAALLASPALGRRATWGIGALALCSFGVQLLGVLPSYLDWYLEVGDYTLVYFSPAYAPLVGHWLAVAAGQVDLFWGKPEAFFPTHTGAIAAIRLALLVATLGSAGLLGRLLQAEGQPRPRPARLLKRSAGGPR